MREVCNESVHGLLRLLAAAVWSSELFAEIAEKEREKLLQRG